MGGDHRIVDWDPKDAAAWDAGNKNIARRNLLCTLAGDHVAFSIWTLWPVMALLMPASVYGFSAGDKLLLGAVATLVGGCARIPYAPGIAAPLHRHDRLRHRLYGFVHPVRDGQWLVFKLIPSSYEARSRSLDVSEAERRRWARARSGALIGICSAIGALGGVGINLALRQSYLSGGTETSAYWMFLASYVATAILAWRMYVRRPASVPSVPETLLTAAPARV
jgi:nitrate/nitrite transporter NarK